jgi:hypothetical protein
MELFGSHEEEKRRRKENTRLNKHPLQSYSAIKF